VNLEKNPQKGPRPVVGQKRSKSCEKLLTFILLAFTVSCFSPVTADAAPRPPFKKHHKHRKHHHRHHRHHHREVIIIKK
jgi:hypothetical protein